MSEQNAETKPKRGKQVKKAAPSLQEIALENCINNLQAAINALCNATVNLQTHDPRLAGPVKSLKETVGDLTVSQAMLATRRKQPDG